MTPAIGCVAGSGVTRTWRRTYSTGASGRRVRLADHEVARAGPGRRAGRRRCGRCSASIAVEQVRQPVDADLLDDDGQLRVALEHAVVDERADEQLRADLRRRRACSAG